jgi:hypothetical protein
MAGSGRSMNMSRFAASLTAISALFLSGAANAQAPAPTLPTTPQAWAQAAQDDVRAATQITRDNHPGIHDPANPQFKRLLDRAQANGLRLASQVRDGAGYVAAIRYFSNTLQDGHAGAYATIDASALPKTKWPGFVAVWRGDAMFVYNSTQGGPKQGARITRCDGIDVTTLIRRNVFAFRGRPTEPGNWWVEGRRLFIDNGNPFVTAPQNCTFLEDNKPVVRPLVWREADATFNQWRDDSYNGVTLPVGMTTRPSGLVWIAMPEFQPNEAQQEAYRTIVSQIEAQRMGISASKAVVLDLRDNQGGSSAWSKMIANALWGNARRNRLMNFYNRGHQSTRWRTSEGNSRHVERLVGTFRTQQMPELAEEWTKIYQGMDAARARGDVFFTEAEDPRPTGRPSLADLPSDPPPLVAPVYVIVPGQCASACLDAVDVFTRFPNVKLIGAPSSADSTYMDIRTEPLPSGLGGVVIPNKVYVNRPRGAGVAYRPAIEVRALDWSTEVFEDVVLADLSRHKR